jgi:arylsulfatase A-like enzyme
LKKLIGDYKTNKQPFFFAFGLKKPHLPFAAPKKYWDMYKDTKFSIAEFQDRPAGAPVYAWQDSWELRGGYGVPKKGKFSEELQLDMIKGYYAALTYSDAQLGKVIKEFEDNGLLENTIIVLWGDHGWHLGDHGMWGKHTNYEQSTRSPLIIYNPGMKNKGTVTSSPSEHIDIYPTLLDLAGLQPPKSQPLEGLSLRPLLNNPKAQVKQLAISQFSRYGKGKHLMGYTYRGKRYRYTKWVTTSDKGQKPGVLMDEELYDYKKDPLETKSLSNNPEYKQVLEKFRSLTKGGYKSLETSEKCDL